MTGIKIALKNKTEGSVRQAIATAISFCEAMSIHPDHVEMSTELYRVLYNEVLTEKGEPPIKPGTNPQPPLSEIFGLVVLLNMGPDPFYLSVGED